MLSYRQGLAPGEAVALWVLGVHRAALRTSAGIRQAFAM